MSQGQVVKGFLKMLWQNYVSHQQSQESSVFRFLDLTCDKTDHTQGQKNACLCLKMIELQMDFSVCSLLTRFYWKVELVVNSLKSPFLW